MKEVEKSLLIFNHHISKAYAIGARIVCRKFANYTDEAVLKYISKLATELKEV